MLADIWARVVAVQDPLPKAIQLGAVAAALAVVLIPGVWRIARHAITIVHEGGHGVVAALTGRRLAGIRLHSDTSGLTVSVGRRRGPGMVLTLLAGYPAASVLGLGAAWLLSLGHAVGLLWVLLVLLAGLLVQIRNWFGLWSVLATGAVLFAVTWFAPAEWQGAFALFVTAFLLLGATRTMLELQASRRRNRRGSSDADQLARLTHLPGLVWVGVFLVLAVGCAYAAGMLLGVLPG